MKSLLDIQQDIRKLENSLKDITESIKAISSDIEIIRTPEQDISIDYELIKVMAKNINYSKNPISKIDDMSEQQTYIEMLINIVRLDIDREVTVNRLTFIQWILNQTEIEYGLEALYKNSIKMSDKLYCEHLHKISENYKEYFVLDALIIANIAGTANMEIQLYVADIASIIGVDSKNLHKLALIARVVLCKNFKSITKDDLRIIQATIWKFYYYISKSMKQELLESLRNIVVQLADSEVSSFSWKAKQRSDVTAGDIIATYNKEIKVLNRTQYKNKKVVAPIDGVIFIFRDKNVNYGVISNKIDSKDSIKEWIKSKTKKSIK